MGKTVTYTESIEANPVNQLESLDDLVNDLNAGKVELLVILGGNPVYDAPADLNFAAALQKAKTRVHSGLYNDETAELCHWHVPAAHFLESWSDARAYDGTASILQPLIQPLYDAHTPHQIIGLFTGDAGKSDHDLVHDYWQSQRPEKGRAFEVFWETSLHDGLIAGTAFARDFRCASPRLGQPGERGISEWRRCERDGNRLPPRPHDWRRRILEQ